MFTLNEIVQAMTGKEYSGNLAGFPEAVIDSRKVSKDVLFAAVPGEHTDGHKFIPSAFADGAAAALIQEEVPGDYDLLDLRNNEISFSAAGHDGKGLCIRVENTVEALQKTAAFHRRQLPKMEVTGITGSVGKTTTKELISDVLTHHFRTLKTQGNMNNEIGLPLTLLRCSDDVEQAVLEMGFYVPGEIDQLCQIALPSVGVITNIGMVHASRAGSMEVIAKGKSELIQALPADGTAILNYDDPYVRPMAGLTNANVFFYGLDPNADLFADRIESFGPKGLKFDLVCRGVRRTVRTSLVGRHSVLTALRGAAVGLVKGMDWDEILAVLETSRSNLRMRFTHTIGGGTLIDDSYNASPDASIAALNLLCEMPGRRIAVLGEMRELGQYEQKGHEMVGKKAAECCDELIAVGQVTKHIVNAASAGGMKPESIHWFAEVPEAIEYLNNGYGKPEDVILVKGSLAMGMYRIVSVLEEQK